MTTKDIGDIGEAAAARFLKKNGYKIIGKNLHFSHNEIDIVAENKEYIVFAEVKTRSAPYNSLYGVPSAAVTRTKQTHLIEAANAYLKDKKTKKQPRMDVLEVWIDKETKEVVNINHIEDAFGVR